MNSSVDALPPGAQLGHRRFLRTGNRSPLPRLPASTQRFLPGKLLQRSDSPIPDACRISLFGPQDLMLHLQKMNGMDAPFAGEDSLTIGDISTTEGRNHLRSISPMYYAGNFREPHLLYYGGKDTLIPPEHSERLYKALRAAGKEVTLVTYPDEAHGFTNPAHEPGSTPVT